MLYIVELVGTVDIVVKNKQSQAGVQVWLSRARFARHGCAFDVRQGNEKEEEVREIAGTVSWKARKLRKVYERHKSKRPTGPRHRQQRVRSLAKRGDWVSRRKTLGHKCVRSSTATALGRSSVVLQQCWSSLASYNIWVH